jgi:hypothetical protein
VGAAFLFGQVAGRSANSTAEANRSLIEKWDVAINN